LMSVVNFSGFVSYQLGALLMRYLNVTESNFEQLWLLILITNLSGMLPLALLGWLPGESELPMEDVVEAVEEPIV